MTSREPFKSEQKRIQPNRVPKKFLETMRVIYAQFDEILAIPYENRPRDKMYLYAKETYLKIEQELKKRGLRASLPVVSKARRALGIRSIHIGGVKQGCFIWRPPTHSPEQVIELIRGNRQRGLDARKNAEIARKIEAAKPENHWAAVLLRKYMVACGCSCPATDVRAEWSSGRRSSTQTLSDAKRVLGIVSLKKPDGWIWVYPAPTVEEWLIAKLASGPIRVESLIAEAEAAGWGYDVVNETRKKIGGIRELFITFGDKDNKRVRHWFDVSVNPNMVADSVAVDESEEENDSV